MSDLAVNKSDVAVDAPDAVTVPDVAVKGEALGRVVSLNGSRVIGMLTSSQAAAGDAPHLQIGSLIKLKGNNTHVFGIINGMSVPMPSAAPEEQMKIVELELIGEVDLPANGEAMSFHVGVSHTPSLDDEFFAADAHDARIIYGSIRETYAFVIECSERQEVGSWTARVSRCGFRRRAG